MRLRAGEGLPRETFALFRECGGGKDECVAYWIGGLDDPDRVDRVVHPVHAASPRHYEVDRTWAVAFALELAEARRAVRMQVHVHPAAAFHSETDDHHAIVSTPGFLSLVVPDRASGPISLAGCHLAELTEHGSWRSVVPAERIELEP
jgi:hypothetical protein